MLAPCCLLVYNSYSNYLVAPKMPFPVSVSKPKSNLSLFEIRVFFFPDWSFSFHHINFCLVDYSSLWTYQIAFLWHDFSSIQFSLSVMPDSLRIHGLQHTRPTCPSPTPRVYSNSGAWSQWCHLTLSYSVVPFSSHLQSFPASGGQSIGVSASASVLPMNIQDWFPLK